jgi:outer membrane protein W
MRLAKWLLISCVVASSAAAAPRRVFKSKSKKAKKTPVVEPAVSTEEDEAPPPDREIEMEPDAEKQTAKVDDPDTIDESELAIEEKPKRKKKRSSWGELYFRAGIARVDPRIKSSGMELQPEGILKLQPMEPVQGSVKTDPTTIFVSSIGYAPALTRGYFAIETIIGIPKRAKLRATGDLANKSLAPMALDLIPTGVPPLGEELGEAQAVPPMVTLQLRSPMLGPVRVYVGGGVSVLFVKDAKVTNKVLTEVATPKLEIDPAIGFVAQAGVDVKLFSRFYARLDFKEMWFQPAETRISNIHVKTTIPLLETVKVGSARSESTANPIIVQLGIGASF